MITYSIKLFCKNYLKRSGIFVRLCSNVKVVQKPAIQSKSKSEFTPSKEIRHHFDAEKLSKILREFPQNLQKKKKKHDHYYIADGKIAKIVADHLTQNLNQHVPLVEVNPGPCLLTTELLEKEVQNIKLFEVNKHFTQHIQEEFNSRFPSRITFKTGDFIGMWKMAFLDKMDNGTRVHDFTFGLPVREWEDGINFRVFACVGSLNFFKHLINSIVFQTSIMSLGRCEFYLIVPPTLYIHLTCNNTAGYVMYRSTSILFQIMFEHEFIETLPRKSFLPWFRKDASPYLAKMKHFDEEYMYFIKVTPRENLFQLCYPEHIRSLWFFIKQNYVSRKNKVIPTLEQWIPGAGKYLILNKNKPDPVGPLENINTTTIPIYTTVSTTMSVRSYYRNLNIFTEFGDLSPSEILTLFHQFKSWPGYKSSPFLSSMQELMLKMETSSEGLVDGIKISEKSDSENASDNIEENTINHLLEKQN